MSGYLDEARRIYDAAMNSTPRSSPRRSRRARGSCSSMSVSELKEGDVDDEQLGAVDVLRITRAGDQLDSINTYRWQYVCDGQQATGTVMHRYGDGAIALIARVLAEIARRHHSSVTPNASPDVPSSRVPLNRPSQWSGV